MEILSITKLPVHHDGKKYFASIDSFYDWHRKHNNYITVKIYVEREKFRCIKKYRKVYDNVYNYDRWEGKFKELITNAVHSYAKSASAKTEIVKRVHDMREDGINELYIWNGEII